MILGVFQKLLIYFRYTLRISGGFPGCFDNALSLKDLQMPQKCTNEVQNAFKNENIRKNCIF